MDKYDKLTKLAKLLSRLMNILLFIILICYILKKWGIINWSWLMVYIPICIYFVILGICLVVLKIIIKRMD